MQEPAVNGARADAHLGRYQRLEAALFDRVADRTGLSTPELAQRLGGALARPTLTTATVRAWRTGDRSAPIEALLAALKLAQGHLGSPAVPLVLDEFAAEEPGPAHPR